MGNPEFTPRCADYAQRVRSSFDLQGAMRHVGAQLLKVEPGHVEIGVAASAELTQQHGFMHGGVVAMVLDSACGYSAFSLMPADSGVLTIEFKINFLAPARGQRLRMVGQVVKPGRTVHVVEGRAWALEGDRETLCATMTATMMTVTGRHDIRN